MVGDLMLDVVLRSARALESGTDVPGSVSFVQGGSAATTACWLGRLGAKATLVTAVGRDAAGRALVEAVRGDKVRVRAIRVPGVRTGRIGVVVAPGGERSFVADRAAADRLHPEDSTRHGSRSRRLHVLVYSPRSASRLASWSTRDRVGGGGSFVSLDLASIGPPWSWPAGRTCSRTEAAPDLLFATAAEAEALLGRYGVEGLLEFAPRAVVKRGRRGRR